MAVGLSAEVQLSAVAGIRLGTARAGISRRERDDLTVIELPAASTCAATFTRNRFCAAPVTVAKRHLAATAPRYLLVNSGNANAGTGQAGIDDALRCCSMLAALAGCRPEEVLPFSTGVIGEPLPVARFEACLPDAFAALDADNWEQAARAIMTTDTVPKGISVEVNHAGERCTITGIVKGSGMIRPDMATMLCYIGTDARVDAATLQGLLNVAVEHSFNRVTVDGDTSTNDACVLVASGQSGFDAEHDVAARAALGAGLDDVCGWLARALVRDGEGATKFIAIEVSGGEDEAQCLQVAYTVAHSPLVKTAFFASDPNWGRILAAVGRAGIDALNIDDVTIHLGDVCIVEHGGRSATYTEAAGQRVMNQAEIDVRIGLGRGRATATVWTSDLSHDYVRINAEYRT